jgi:hypothetical protein
MSQDGSSNDDTLSSAYNETTPPLVTQEMFWRDLLEDPAASSALVKRKNKSKRNNEYRVLDNRDSLPFAVEITTPDPYTHPEVKNRNAQKQKRKPGTIESAIASTLYINRNGSVDDDDDDEAHKTKLGEFMLDKHTTTGDVLEVGDVQYKVVRHKCQYKYAGGKRFVMIRKILQVKEISRLQTEEYLARQLKMSPTE